MIKMDLFPASKLQTFDVTNDRGEKLGRVEDFMIDATSGRVAYVVVAFGGALGSWDKLFAMPLEALCWSPENKKFVADISERRSNGRQVSKGENGLATTWIARQGG